MRAWLRQHRQALARGASRVGVLNIVVIGVALALPAGGYALLESLRTLTGRLSLEQQLHHVRQGHGQSGANRDYVIATVGALEQLGYRETELHLLAARLAGTHEASASSMPPSS